MLRHCTTQAHSQEHGSQAELGTWAALVVRAIIVCTISLRLLIPVAWQGAWRLVLGVLVCDLLSDA